MICERCGYENPPETRFCGKCGSPINNDFSKKECVLKHSELGIASLIIGFFSGILMVVLIILATMLHCRELTENDSPVVLCGIGLILDSMFLFLGMILGIVGLFMHRRNKLTAIIGIILNTLPFLLFIFLLLLGFLYAQK